MKQSLSPDSTARKRRCPTSISCIGPICVASDPRVARPDTRSFLSLDAGALPLELASQMMEGLVQRHLRPLKKKGETALLPVGTEQSKSGRTIPS